MPTTKPSPGRGASACIFLQRQLVGGLRRAERLPPGVWWPSCDRTTHWWQIDLEFKAILSYTVSPKPAWAPQNPALKYEETEWLYMSEISWHSGGRVTVKDQPGLYETLSQTEQKLCFSLQGDVNSRFLQFNL